MPAEGSKQLAAAKLSRSAEGSKQRAAAKLSRSAEGSKQLAAAELSRSAEGSKQLAAAKLSRSAEGSKQLAAAELPRSRWALYMARRRQDPVFKEHEKRRTAASRAKKRLSPSYREREKNYRAAYLERKRQERLHDSSFHCRTRERQAEYREREKIKRATETRERQEMYREMEKIRKETEGLMETSKYRPIQCRTTYASNNILNASNRGSIIKFTYPLLTPITNYISSGRVDSDIIVDNVHNVEDIGKPPSIEIIKAEEDINVDMYLDFFKTISSVYL